MKKLKLGGLIISSLLLVSSFTACSDKKDEDEIRVYSSFFNAQLNPIDPDNDIQQIIAEKTGAKCIESWLQEGDDSEKIISNMIMSNEYPDFIYPSADGCQKLIQANALIPIDEYWDDYPNLKNYFTEDEWNRIRYEDGHVYYVPSFSKCYMYDTNTMMRHSGYR